MQITSVLSEVSVNYRPRLKASEMMKVTSSHDSVHCFREIWSDKMAYIEECCLLLLNRANRLLGYVKLSSGGTAGTIVDIKVIFQAALKTNAHSIILAHNHPSGQLKASEQDIKLTKEISAAGKILNIPLLDHIILTEEAHYSFADEGLI